MALGTRLYIPTPLAGLGELALSTDSVAHLRARRVRPGAPLTLFDGRGGEYAAVLETLERHRGHVRLGAWSPLERESPLQVTLLQGLCKGERMDFAVQKATELGVAGIVPVLSAHSVVRLTAERARRRQAHWQQIAASACEQCGRNRIPVVHTPRDLADAIDESPVASGLVLDAAAGTNLAAAGCSTTTVGLLVGPEGGLTAHELDHATSRDWQGVSLGPRVLRAETAAAAALSALQVSAGDLG